MHEATLHRLAKFGQPDGSNTKVNTTNLFFAAPLPTKNVQIKLARMLRTIREPTPRVPWTTLLDQVKGDLIAAEKLDMMEPRDLSKVAISERQRRESHTI